MHGRGQHWLQLHKLGHVNIDLHQEPAHVHASWTLAGTRPHQLRLVMNDVSAFFFLPISDSDADIN